MAAFFSLGTPGSSGSQNPQNPPHDQIYHNYPLHCPNNNNNPEISLYTNPTPTPNPNPNPNRGFQIWQQYVEVHHHHRHPHAAAGPPFLLGRSKAEGGGGSGMNCQDCGNKAKKDCAHMRCRTCCKSRGLDCSTHVKSTWVPAAKRRERHHKQLALRQLEEEELARREKRVRDNRSAGPDQTLLPFTTTTTAGLEVGHNNSLPSEVSSPAMFKCVRVMSATEDEPEEHIAYQTAVNIGGHVFKGILYNQGPDQNSSASYDIAGAAESSSGGSGGGGGRGGPQQNNHLFLATTATTSPGGGGGVTAMLDPSCSAIVYPAPMNAFMAGTQFLFPHSRS